jgi:hypothetical protein
MPSQKLSFLSFGYFFKHLKEFTLDYYRNILIFFVLKIYTSIKFFNFGRNVVLLKLFDFIKNTIFICHQTLERKTESQKHLAIMTFFTNCSEYFYLALSFQRI